MKSEAEEKLKRIADIWNHFILEYKFCNRKIKFTEDVKSNYFGDILGYFLDTFDIIFEEKNPSSFSDRFAYHISLLQAIYIQQDFVEELLLIFKCGINKGHLKNNENYSINREIRNELVGHPIRKTEIPIEEFNVNKCESCGTITNKPKNKSVLLSSTLFSYDSNNKTIEYLRYHKDNNYQFETKTFEISDILKRHKEFLNKYFDKILEKLKGILDKYERELIKLENSVDKQDFETMIKLVSISFESILKSDYLYNEVSLIEIYKRRKEHKRYQNFIDKFYLDLKNGIIETRKYTKELFEPKQFDNNVELPKINISFVDFSNSEVKFNKETKVTYHYELGKLATKRNINDFDFFSGFLKTKCSKNKLVMNELKHMRNNISNEIEYYTAFRLICKELKQ